MSFVKEVLTISIKDWNNIQYLEDWSNLNLIANIVISDKNEKNSIVHNAEHHRKNSEKKLLTLRFWHNAHCNVCKIA